MDDLIQVGVIQEHYNVSYTRILKYSVELFHKGLKEHKIISAPEQDMLENKMELQTQKWSDRWTQIQNKQYVYYTKETKAASALSLTKKAEDAVKEIDNILTYTLTVNDAINWNKLKDTNKFREKNPADVLESLINKIPLPKKHQLKQYPIKPDINSPRFQRKLSFFDKLLSSRRKSIEQKIQYDFDHAIVEWKKLHKEIEKANEEIIRLNTIEVENYEKIKQHVIQQNQNDIKQWEQKGINFLRNQETYNAKIELLKESYLKLDESAILEYCQLVLNNSKYPESFTVNFELEYSVDNKILIVEYELPSKECFPKIKEVKYIANRDEMKETFLSESQLNKMFDDAMYQIALRTIHELFESDQVDAVKAISFNGWVRSINKATGKEETNCILSIQVKKDEFIEIDLANVDPKTCFKNLKGVASSKLSSLTPVQPILQINKTDKRFVDSYNVADGIDNSTNIAAMNWEDFEHLIRELFEKEFQSNGGEVKVTQASRDGGVDAVAFDPDPIRGGKIVIQAKRYTNTVGVSAVRDLYGTVMNEGATKGILVSTADYGPDAYEFAKGKPLTLLNGSNLLHLLEKHGHHAKIDLREAKKILNEKEK